MSLFVDIRKKVGNFQLNVKLENNNEVCCLLGQSGCGKSMTLKCISGVEKPDEGKIILDNNVLFDSEKGINLPPQKRQIGYLFQNYALFPNMTLRENILCGIKCEKNRLVREEKLKEIISKFRLEGLENHKPAQLSGGQAQRCALGRIMIGNPKMILLDEPFSALDSHLRDMLKIEMRDLLKSFGKDVIMVTHSRDEAYNFGDRIAVMDKGQILTVKNTKALFSDPGSVEAAIITGCKNIVPAQKVDDYKVYIPTWGISLNTQNYVKDNLKAIGIRAHYFNPATPNNRYNVEFAEEMEEPFEWIVQFRYTAGDYNAQPIWWRVPKDKKPKEFPKELGVSPANILLLY